jgi:hypothetical protein
MLIKSFADERFVKPSAFSGKEGFHPEGAPLRYAPPVNNLLIFYYPL